MINKMSLGIAVTKSPFKKPSDEENFDLAQDVTIEEWDELFLNVLEVQDITLHKDESRIDFLDRRERLFQEILISKGYEMLWRICHFSMDAFYAHSEVEKLLEECLRLQQKTQNVLALSGLKKLIFASNKAHRVKSGIWLVSD